MVSSHKDKATSCLHTNWPFAIEQIEHLPLDYQTIPKSKLISMVLDILQTKILFERSLGQGQISNLPNT